MDQALVASIRTSLESKSTEELRQIFESGHKAGKSPEEFEAIRQILDERGTKSYRPMLAVTSAIIMGTIGAAGAWWQLGPDVFVVLAGLGGATLGFASWYIPGLIYGQ
jgi:hypothetical protein